MEIIGFINRKGGSNKTTTCMSFADVLAKKGYKVLVIDLDSQYGMTATYNILEDYPDDSTRYSMYHVLTNKVKIEEAILRVQDAYFTDARVEYKCVNKEWLSILREENTRKSFKGSIDIIPSDSLVGEQLKKELKFNQNNLLFNVLKELPKDKYDFVLLDTHPGEDDITYMSLVAADDIIVPCTLDEESLRGVYKIQNILNDMRAAKVDVPDKVCGYLVTNVELVATKQRNIKELDELEKIADKFETRVFKSIIRRHPSVVDLKSFHSTILNKKIITTAKLESGIDAHNEVFNLDKITVNKKQWAKDQDGKKIKVKKADYTTVAQDYIAAVEEYLNMKGIK